jgi:hypothetical protein
MVGDLRMWLYRAIPGNHDRCVGADHSLPATGRRRPSGYGSILSKELLLVATHVTSGCRSARMASHARISPVRA